MSVHLTLHKSVDFIFQCILAAYSIANGSYSFRATNHSKKESAFDGFAEKHIQYSKKKSIDYKHTTVGAIASIL